MQKLLLSLTVILASGAYAYAERQAVPSGTVSSDAGAGAVASPAAPEQQLSSAAPAPAVAPSAPAAPAPAAVVAPATPSPTAAAVPASNETQTVQVAAIDPPAPLDPGTTVVSDATASNGIPLPRPRPADAPQAPVATAQATARTAQAPLAIAQVAAGTPQGQYRDGTYKGNSANAYYGRVQVAAVIQGGKIVSVKVLQYPNDRRTSQYINSQALPMLQQEVIQAQNANVDTVSGATLTSEAYMQSLGHALQAAGGGNA